MIRGKCCHAIIFHSIPLLLTDRCALFQRYSLPKKKSGTSDLVLLLRTGGHQHGSKALPQLWASRCTVPSGGNGDAGSTGGMLLGGEAQRTLSNLSTFSCKSGTGSFEYKEPSLAQHGGDASAVTANAGNTNIGASSSSSNSNLNCNWSVPEMTNIPDAPSRTCAGHLPNNGGIGLIGTALLCSALPLIPLCGFVYVGLCMWMWW